MDKKCKKIGPTFVPLLGRCIVILTWKLEQRLCNAHKICTKLVYRVVKQWRCILHNLTRFLEFFARTTWTVEKTLIWELGLTLLGCDGVISIDKMLKQSHYTPWGFQKDVAPRFQDKRHMNVVKLSALHTGRLYLQEYIPGTHFCCGPGVA